MGEKSGDKFGSAVAISQDGSHFIAGAPGASGPGYARMYSWLETSNQWLLSAVIRGLDDNEAFGSSVSVLSMTGDYVAVGGPGYANGAGRVSVYQLDPSNGRYKQFGPDILGGAPGDGIGYAGGLSGGLGPTGPVVVLATQQGLVQRHDYNLNTNLWEQRYDDVAFPASEQASVAFSMGEDFDTLVLGLVGASSNQTRIYQTTAGAALNVTSAPSSSPIGTTTFSPVPPPVPTSNIFDTPSPVAVVTSTAPTPPSAVVLDSDAPSRSPVTTPSPTMTPIKNSVVTQSPTIMNTNALWTVSGGPFSTGTSGTTSVVALSESRLVVASGNSGVVHTWTRQTVGFGVLTVWDETRVPPVVYTDAANATTSLVPAITISSSSSDEEVLVVGAPSTPRSGVYCYVMDGTTNTWTPLGSPLRSDDAPEADFGAAVAIHISSSDSTVTKRLAVGAPQYSADGVTPRGRVYLYEYSDAASDWTEAATLEGGAAQEQFGAALDMAASFLVIGSPGSGGTNATGAATIYQSSGSASTWFVVTTIFGEQAGEGLGTAVHMLSPDGAVVAVGGPGYAQGRGRVLVYERNALTGRFALLGTPIVGASEGDGLGQTNRLSGYCNADQSIISVLVAAQNGGRVYKYEWSKANAGSWMVSVIVLPSAPISSLAALSSASNLLAVSNGSSGETTVYEE